MLNSSRKPGSTRKAQSYLSISCENLLANSDFLVSTIFWSLEKYDYNDRFQFVKKCSLESTGAVTSSFHVPLGIFSLETAVLTGGLTPLISWGKLVRGSRYCANLSSWLWIQHLMDNRDAKLFQPSMNKKTLMLEHVRESRSRHIW